MEEFNLGTPEGLQRFLLAEAELDNELYGDEMLKGYLNENRLRPSEYAHIKRALATTEA